MDRYDYILKLDADSFPEIRPNEREEYAKIHEEFVADYAQKPETQEFDEWFCQSLKTKIPELSDEKAKEIANEILSEIRINSAKLESLQAASQRGISKETWFAREIKNATSSLSGHQAAVYLQNLDNAVKHANEALTDTIMTKAGTVSMNPNLDGYIAEQYHAQTFNLNATAKGSHYRARVLSPDGERYTKNSVDIVIDEVAENGDTVRKNVCRYQSKYCKDAETTQKALQNGDYRGQQKVVPSDQQGDINVKTTDHLEAPDGSASSNPMTKAQAKKLQEDAQSGNWNDLDWNEYKLQDVAVGIGKQAGRAALLGAAIGMGMSIVRQAASNEGMVRIDETVMDGLKTGSSFGIKAIIAGALKVASEKELITIIPKGTPAAVIADIVHVGVENVKVISRVAKGELTIEEGANEMEKVTVSTIAGIATAAEGATIGANIGAFAGPIGVAIGGFVGSVAGYMIGSGITEKVVSTVQRFRKRVFKAVREEAELLADEVRYSAAERRKWYAAHPLLA